MLLDENGGICGLECLNRLRAAREYQKHRERVQNAKSLVDHKPPKLFLGSLIRSSKLEDDEANNRRIMGANLAALVNLNAIDRTGGQIKSFRGTDASFRSSRLAYLRLLKKAIYEKNRKFGTRLLLAQPIINSWMEKKYLSPRVRSETLKAVPFEMPEKILAKYKNLTLPPTLAMKRKLLRPKIFFNFYMKNMRPLGRVVIQLYTEACPQVVLEFVRACAYKQHERLKVLRMFQSLWLECVLNLDSHPVINRRNLEYDMRALNHGSAPGILSISKNDAKTMRHGILHFTISLKPLTVLNGRRIGFGIVLHGQKLLDSLQVYGMKKSGKLVKEITISGMGIWQKS